MNIAPTRQLDDGLLDVTVVGAMTRRQMLANFPKVFKGTHVAHPLVSTFRGARVELESLDPSVPMDVYADGERVGPLPATMEAVPRRAHRARAVARRGERSTSRRPSAGLPSASACASVIVGPVTWTTPCMPAARWPGTAQKNV